MNQSAGKDSSTNFSLLDLIHGFVECGTKRGIVSFPPFGDELWHKLLYKLRQIKESDAALIKTIGQFDWDGSDPKNQMLPEIMFGMRNICSERAFQDWRIYLDDLLPAPAINSHLSKDVRYTKTISSALELANDMPGFLER